MQRKTLLVVLCCLLVVLIGLVAVLAVYVMNGKSDDGDSYIKHFDLGEKYFEDGDYEQAIAEYLAAIEADPTEEDAYYYLALAYKKLGEMDKMKDILEDGIEETDSKRLKDLYDRYFGKNEENTEDKTEEPKKEPGTTANYSLSVPFSEICANYTYADYCARYNLYNERESNGAYQMTLNALKATMYFENESTYDSIDEQTGEPYDDVRPLYIVLDDLSTLISGISSGDKLTVNDIKAMGAEDVTKTTDRELGSCVEFKYNHCNILIALDSNGKFELTSANRIYSEFGTGADMREEQKKEFENTIHIVDATTGNGVANADVFVTLEESIDSEVIYETKTDDNGDCVIKLGEGYYYLRVECEGFIIEAFAIEIYSSGVCSVDNFVVSPELVSGEMRIVLEWGDYPSDLDSYLIDSNGYVAVNYQGKTWYGNDGVLAELDVDDTSSYGPETITVYDTTQDFTYYVHDFSDTGTMFSRQDVTVKVYLPGQSAPEVYVIPLSYSENRGWCVFSWVDGRIITQNTEVYQRDDFTHVG